MISQAVVGWLILAAAVLVLVGGAMARAFLGNRPDTHAVRRGVRRVRGTRVSRLLLGPMRGDALDPDDLDEMILMPAIVVACGLCLTALFLLGYDSIT